MSNRVRRTYGAAADIPMSVWTPDGRDLATPTFVAGDITVSIDGGAWANIAALPTPYPDGDVFDVQLSVAEMTGKLIVVRFKDQDGPVFAQDLIVIETEGHPSAFRTGDFNNLDATVSSRASSAEISALNNLSAAEVKTQVEDSIFSDARAEPTGVPAATGSFGDKVLYAAMPARNRYDSTDTQEVLYADDDTTPVGTRVISKSPDLVTKNKAT